MTHPTNPGGWPDAPVVLLHVTMIDGFAYVRAENAHSAVTEARKQERDEIAAHVAAARAEERERCFRLTDARRKRSSGKADRCAEVGNFGQHRTHSHAAEQMALLLNEIEHPEIADRGTP